MDDEDSFIYQITSLSSSYQVVSVVHTHHCLIMCLMDSHAGYEKSQSQSVCKFKF